jgi:hypothetical protein
MEGATGTLGYQRKPDVALSQRKYAYRRRYSRWQPAPYSGT